MDDLVATGEKIKKANKKVSNVLVQQVGKVGNAYYTYPYLSAFGGGIFATKANGDYDASKVIVNSAGSIKGATELAKLGKAKVLTTNVDDTNAEAIFDGGKAPYFFTGPWATPTPRRPASSTPSARCPASTASRCSRSWASRCSTCRPRPRTPRSRRSS